jgi:hypothetical protein
MTQADEPITDHEFSPCMTHPDEDVCRKVLTDAFVRPTSAVLCGSSRARHQLQQVPQLVLDPPSGPTATWYPNVRAIVIATSQGSEITLSAAEVRRLYEWVSLHELR